MGKWLSFFSFLPYFFFRGYMSPRSPITSELIKRQKNITPPSEKKMNYIYRTSGYTYIYTFFCVYTARIITRVYEEGGKQKITTATNECVWDNSFYDIQRRGIARHGRERKKKKTNPELPTSGLPAILCPLHERIVNDDGPVLSYYPSSSILKLTSLGLAWLKGSFPIIMMREQPKFEVFCFLCPPPARYLKDSFTVRRIRRRRHQREK